MRKIIIAALAALGIAGGATACSAAASGTSQTAVQINAQALKAVDGGQLALGVYETNLSAALNHCTQDASALATDVNSTAARIGVSNIQVLQDLVDHNQTVHGKVDCGKELASW